MYSDPCDLLVPPWAIAAVKLFTYSYVTGFPMWHLAVTLERILATRWADKYEALGPSFGIATSLVVVSVGCEKPKKRIRFSGLGHTAYLISVAYQDSVFRSGTPFVGLSTKNNLEQMRWRGYILIALDVGTLVVDAATASANKYRIRRVATEYSLSRSYQTSKNVVVTMGLILPLDICNAVLFLASRGVEIIFRSQAAWSVHLVALLELAFTVIVVQLPLSLLITLLLCKEIKRMAVLYDRKTDGALLRTVSEADQLRRRKAG